MPEEISSYKKNSSGQTAVYIRMEGSMEKVWNTAGQEADIPVTEPQRQYYFIERAKKDLAEMSRAAGRPLTFWVTTFGCQMNARDSEKLTGILEQIG